MSFFEALVVLSLLVVIAIITRMLGAIRVLNGRVDLLSEQLRESATTMRRPTRAAAEAAAREALSAGERSTNVVDDPELAAMFANMDEQHGQLKKKMGRDFQMPAPRRPAPRPGTAAGDQAFADAHDPLRRLKKK